MRRNDGTTERVRKSALWGTGGTKGDSRNSALWGKGGRGLLVAAAAIVTLAFPFAAEAGGTPSVGDYMARWLHTQQLLTAPPAPPVTPVPEAPTTYLSPVLKDKTTSHPQEMVSVIVQSTDGSEAATDALNKVMGKRSSSLQTLDLVGGAAVDIPAAKLGDLQQIPGLTITPDSPVRMSGVFDSYTSDQVWPAETGNSFGWGNKLDPAAVAPTIAIIDSGIDARRADFDNGKRVLAQVNMTSLPGNSAGDGRGHGTFVAGIAAGSAPKFAGASPKSNIVMLDVMDDNGMARTSDVIRAAQWIVANRKTYNIRVANLSLHSTTPSNFTVDPLDRAVEQLWFAGVTVVVAAGNYGVETGPSGVLYAPGNDPFVITVGALDPGTTASATDDFAAPWSAYGSTYDGFMKPEVSAPGRFMVGPVPGLSSVVKEKKKNVVGLGYIQLSGTSFAAPIVAGTVAQMLVAHPTWTPDQVKGALMATTRKVSASSPVNAAGTGIVTASRAISWPQYKAVPNPNLALAQFVRPIYGTQIFDGAAWARAAKSNSSWDDVSWHSESWNDVSWHSSSGNDASWQDVSWSSVSWSSVSSQDMAGADSAADMSKEDAVEGDANATGGVLLTDDQFLQVLCDPFVNPNPIPATCPPPAMPKA